MPARFRFHSVRTKLIALGAVFGVVLIVFTVVAASTFASMTSGSTGAGKASKLEAQVDETFQDWTSDDGQNSLSEFNSSDTAVGGSPFAAGILNPGPVAINASGDIWTLNLNANLGVLTGVGAPVSGAPYNTSSSTTASNFALDGVGNAWIVTRTSSGNPLNPFFYQIAGVSNSGNVLSGSLG